MSWCFCPAWVVVSSVSAPCGLLAASVPGAVRLSPWTVSTAPSNAHTGGWLVYWRTSFEAPLWSVSRCALGLAGGDVDGASEGGVGSPPRSVGVAAAGGLLGRVRAPSTRFSIRRCGWAGRGSRSGTGAPRFPRSKRCTGEHHRPTRVERREARLVRGLHTGAGGRDGGRPRGGVGGEARRRRVGRTCACTERLACSEGSGRPPRIEGWIGLGSSATTRTPSNAR